MGRLKLTSGQMKRVSAAMIAITALMLVDGVYQIGIHVWWRRWIPTTPFAQGATTQPASTQSAGTQPAGTQPTGTQPASTQPASTQPTGTRPAGGKLPVEGSKNQSPKPSEVAAAIRNRNIFTEPKPKGHGLRLTGVIGKVALFQRREGETIGIEEGNSANGITVKSIRDYEVVIEYQGKSETMKLFSESGGGPAASGGGPAASGGGPAASGGGPAADMGDFSRKSVRRRR